MLDDYTALDIETTGLNPKLDRIIEVGAVRVRGGKVTDTYESFVNPGRALEERICSLTGISEDMLKDAPEAGDIIVSLMDFIGEDILVGHKILFDYSFIKKTAVNSKLSFEKKGIDTLKLANRFLQELPSRKLEYLCRYYGIEHTAHRALGDARAASDLYLRLKELFYKEENAKDFTPRQLICQVKKETPITKSQKERLYKLLDKHKITIEYDADKLTRNEADRIMDKILAEYGR